MAKTNEIAVCFQLRFSDQLRLYVSLSGRCFNPMQYTTEKAGSDNPQSNRSYRPRSRIHWWIHSPDLGIWSSDPLIASIVLWPTKPHNVSDEELLHCVTIHPKSIRPLRVVEWNGQLWGQNGGRALQRHNAPNNPGHPRVPFRKRKPFAARHQVCCSYSFLSVSSRQSISTPECQQVPTPGSSSHILPAWNFYTSFFFLFCFSLPHLCNLILIHVFFKNIWVAVVTS